MAVASISSGAQVSIDQMNALYLELNRKVDAAMDGHSILFAQESGYPVEMIGPRYNFLGSDSFFYKKIFASEFGTYGLTRTYRHSVFTDVINDASVSFGGGAYEPLNLREIVSTETNYAALAAAVTASVPAPPGAINTCGLLDASLECHNKSGHHTWVRGSSLFVPLRFANIDIVFDGWSLYLWQSNWNRFNFFRFHNLHITPLEITFEGAGYSVTIPAGGSLCVRRDPKLDAFGNPDPQYFVDGKPVFDQYTTGYSYFHKFKLGDPMFMQKENDPGMAGLPVPCKANSYQ